MKLNAKEIKKLSAIKNSFYDDLKIEFLYHSNLLEGSTFSKENIEKSDGKENVEKFLKNSEENSEYLVRVARGRTPGHILQ